jgi:hypothetical protein
MRLVVVGRRRLCDFHRGRPPRNKGLQYPADPPTVEEIVAVMATPEIGRTACGRER